MLMDIFTARPKKIIGNVALASLLAGPPVGVALSVLGGLLQPTEHSMLEWAKSIGSGLLVGPFVIFIGGLVVVAPLLSLLRYFGYGGPMAVYAIATLFGLWAISDDLRFGLVVLVFSLPASYVFCRHSYSE
jgi:hypothetical protein